MIGLPSVATGHSWPAETGNAFALEFEHRSDNGPRLVGPFPTRGHADNYARALQLKEAVYCVCPIKTP